MLKIEQIDHVALTVKHVDRAVAWYRDVLGLERRYQEAWGDYPAVMCAGDTGVALFPAGDGQSVEPADPRRAATMRHIAFRVDRANFARAQAELTARKIPFHFEDHDISQSIYFRDLDGYEIEITSYERNETGSG